MMLFLCEYVASSFFFLLYSPQTRARAICNCRCIIIITSNHTKQIHTGLRLQSHKIQLIFSFFQMENEQRKPKWISMQNFVSVLLCVRVCLLYIFWRLFSERKTPLCLACIWSVFFFIDFFGFCFFSSEKERKKATYKCDKIDQLNWWIPSTAMSADVGPVQ